MTRDGNPLKKIGVRLQNVDISVTVPVFGKPMTDT
jgi:hypothetical protein